MPDSHRGSELMKAVILARGLGKRMREDDPTALLSGEQRDAADSGAKAMIPVGRPFLDFVLSALADAGIQSVCLVVGPEHRSMREYYASLDPQRIKISFAVQEQPIGTANALLSARKFLANEPFLTLNSDNYYPTEVFQALRDLGESGLPAFGRKALLRESNIPEERVRDYALLEIDGGGYLEKIIEKPGRLLNGHTEEELFISMNCWRFDTAIFEACERVPRSARGEFELPEAVQYGMSSLGLRFKTVPFHTGVLDLSRRSDIAGVAEQLRDTTIRL